MIREHGPVSERYGPETDWQPTRLLIWFSIRSMFSSVLKKFSKVFKHFWLVEVFWRSEISFLKFDWSFFDFVKYLKWNFLELDKCSKSKKNSQTLQKWCYVSDSKMTRDVTNLVSSSLHLRWHFWCDITDFALFLGIFKMNCEILF